MGLGVDSLFLLFFLQYTVPGQVEPPQGQGLRHGPFAPSCCPSGVRAGKQRGGGGAEVLVVGQTLGQGKWPVGSHARTQLHVPARTLMNLVVMSTIIMMMITMTIIK